MKECICKQLVIGSASVDERLDHVASATGKMVRPALVLFSGKCCGITGDLHLEIASIIEMVHVATLLHDDVIDHADSRRSCCAWLDHRTGNWNELEVQIADRQRHISASDLILESNPMQ